MAEGQKFIADAVLFPPNILNQNIFKNSDQDMAGEKQQEDHPR